MLVVLVAISAVFVYTIIRMWKFVSTISAAAKNQYGMLVKLATSILTVLSFTIYFVSYQVISYTTESRTLQEVFDQ
jgi:heme/copper-type cytochrome/quinol oxidase subunit 2